MLYRLAVALIAAISLLPYACWCAEECVDSAARAEKTLAYVRNLTVDQWRNNANASLLCELLSIDCGCRFLLNNADLFWWIVDHKPQMLHDIDPAKVRPIFFNRFPMAPFTYNLASRIPAPLLRSIVLANADALDLDLCLFHSLENAHEILSPLMAKKNKSGFFPFTLDRSFSSFPESVVKLTADAYVFLPYRDDFVLWLMARQLDLYWHSMPKQKQRKGPCRRFLTVANAPSSSPEYYLQKHPDLISQELLQVAFVPGAIADSTVRLNMHFADSGNDWLMAAFSRYFDEPLLSITGASVLRYANLSLSECAIFRMFMYLAFLNADITNADTLSTVTDCFRVGFSGKEMSKTELEFFYDLCIETGFVSLVFEILQKPAASVATAFLDDMVKATEFWEFGQSGVLPTKLLALIKKMSNNGRKLKPPQLTGPRIESYFHEKRWAKMQHDADGVDSPITGQDNLKTIAASHFLSETDGRRFLNWNDGYFERRESLNRAFALPFLPDQILNQRLAHFYLYLSEEDGGEKLWWEENPAPEYVAFDNNLKAFVQTMLDILNFLSKGPARDADIRVANSDSRGSGVFRHAISVMSEVIFLPCIGLFRHSTNGRGFMPYPFLHPQYMALIAELHMQMLKLDTPFPWHIRAEYRDFLFHNEDLTVKMEELVERIYDSDFRSLASIATSEDICITYPKAFKLHVPLNIPAMVDTPQCWFTFDSPLNDRCTHEGNPTESDQEIYRPTSPERLQQYKAQLAKALVPILLEQRAAYIWNFMRCLDRSFWLRIDSEFMRQYAETVNLDSVSLESILSMTAVHVAGDWKIFFGFDGNDEVILLTPEDTFKVILSSFTPTQLAKFYRLMTGHRRLPLATRANRGRITIRALHPPPPLLLYNETASESDEPENSSKKLPSIPYPRTSTCSRNMIWTLFPTYEENLEAFLVAIENQDFLRV